MLSGHIIDEGIMKNVQDYYLEPGEYVSKSVVGSLPGFHFAVLHGLMITKDGANTWIRTPCNVDEGCRILLRWSGKGAGRVKHLTSTPRRRYYLCLMWFTIIMWVLAWIFLFTEMLVFNNPAVGDSRTRLVMLTAFTAWMGFDITVMRNGHGFTKWFITIFSYGVLAISTGAFIAYLIRFIQEIGVL